MKLSILNVFFLFLSCTVYCQRLELKSIGFSMDIPKDWISNNDEDIIKNLNEYDFTDKQLSELLKSNESGVNVATYTKYDSKKYAGIIPTIKIRTLSNPTTSNNEFLKFVVNTNENVKKALDDFRFVVKPSIIKISNQEVVKFSVKFSLKNAGNQYDIVSNSYYIPKDGYFISLNFIEQVGKEDNQKIFEELIRSIKLNK